MKKHSLFPRKNFWRADWFTGIAMVVAVALLHVSSDLIGSLERRFYDVASTSAVREPSDRIAVIAIDDQSIANLGRWPWPRNVHAQLIDLLAAARAKTIVHTAFFFEPQVDPGLHYILKIKAALSANANYSNADMDQLIAQAETALDTDSALATSMRRAGNVLIPSVYTLGEPQGKADHPLPDYVRPSTLEDIAGFSVYALRAQQPIASIGQAAAGIGHLNQFQDIDGTVRQEPLLVNYFGRAVPSLALLAAAHSLNLNSTDIQQQPQDTVRLGRLQIHTDATALMRPQFYKGQGANAAFAVDSFFDVISGKIAADKYADKIVIIGATAAGVGSQFSVPGYPAISPAQALAHMTSSILREHFIVQPPWGPWATLLGFLLVAAYVVAALPRLSAGKAASMTLGLLVLMVATEFCLLAFGALWLQLVFPAAALVLGHLALTTKRFLMTEAGKTKADHESAETNRMMALALQGQGQLDMAFDRMRRVPLGDAVMGNLYNLALDFERKRQFNKAQAVYEHMGVQDRDYKDIRTRHHRAKNLAETVLWGGAAQHPGGTMQLQDDTLEKPMLGRYQIEKELGKGSMGAVYLGKDPKIGRVVAIKTMALGQEFASEDLDDARARFFREAETAGRLQHQNIVTIFDAGEEHDLAYIAMEFLQGRDLVDHCKRNNLLPIHVVVSIGERVARALAYAHQHHVVHRDIKPANIMYDSHSDTVKVTDFGIARITDSSRTKTGLVLGTPSFMSPEQLAGKTIDGRSDLYSLGAMLFQLLTGELPFRGDSLAELMYKIANEQAQDVRSIRPEISPAIATIVARSMCKQVQERYATGDAMAADLHNALLPGSPVLPPGGTPDPGSASHAFADTVVLPVQRSVTSTAKPRTDLDT